MGNSKTTNNKEPFDNDYALDVKGVPIYIGNAESGRKGYFCGGCGNQMEAVKTQIENRRSYFRHIAEFVKRTERECTYSNESYRHTLAKMTLLQNKEVKVPTLYKSHPDDKTLPRKIVKKSEVIKASSVQLELYFFEDENGTIKWAKKLNLKQMENLLINPDVTFFNKDGKPILLIEIIATHKIDEEKLTRINRLAIDTIQIKIPKGSPQDIENALRRTHGTKWIFNYEQKTTSYLQFPDSNSEGVPPPDEFEKKLLETEQSFYCRENELNNLLRKIRDCLEKEQYQGIERRIRRDLSRVKNITKEHQLQWNGIQKIQDEAVEREIAAERTASNERVKQRRRALRERRTEFNQQNSKLKIRLQILDGRYKAKKGSLDREEEGYRPKCQKEIEYLEGRLESLAGEGGTFEEREEAFRVEERDFEQHIESESNRVRADSSGRTENIEGLRSSIESAPKEFESEEKRLAGEFEKSKKTEQRRFDEMRTAIEEALRNTDITGIESDAYPYSIFRGLIQAGETTKAIQLLESQIKGFTAIKNFSD